MLIPRFKFKDESLRFREEQYLCVEYEEKYFPLYERICVTTQDGVRVIGDLYWIYDDCLDLLIEDLRVRISYIQIRSIEEIKELQ